MTRRVFRLFATLALARCRGAHAEPRTGWRTQCAALLLALTLATPALAHPALWAVKDADTTVYLFGTVHLLPQDTDWHFPGLDKALADSQVLYVEITDDDQANMTALVLRYGMDMAHPLSGLLTPFDRDRLERAARLADVPGGIAALNLMRPWLAALTLTVAPLTKAGLDPAEGVDKQLRAAMTNAGKPVRGLETAEQQIRFLADLPQAMQLAMLRSTLRDTDRGGPEGHHRCLEGRRRGRPRPAGERPDAPRDPRALPAPAGRAQRGLGQAHRRHAAAARHALHRRGRGPPGRTGQRAGTAGQGRHRRTTAVGVAPAGCGPPAGRCPQVVDPPAK
jgi:hypothetical protein